MINRSKIEARKIEIKRKTEIKIKILKGVLEEKKKEAKKEMKKSKMEVKKVTKGER